MPFKQEIIRQLLFRPTFFTLKDLKKYAQDLIRFFEEEDGNLEAIGLPSKQFEHWYTPFGFWQNLYYTKIPYDFVTAGRVPANAWKESLVKRDSKFLRTRIDEAKAGAHTPFIWMKRPPSILENKPAFGHDQGDTYSKAVLRLEKLDHSFGKYGYWRDSKGNLFGESGEKVRIVSFVEAKRLPWISAEKEMRIFSTRSKLLKAKSRSLVYILNYLTKVPRDSTTEVPSAHLGELIENCANALVDELGADELRFLLDMDGLFIDRNLLNSGGILSLVWTLGFLSAATSRDYLIAIGRLRKIRRSSEGDFPIYDHSQVTDKLADQIFDSDKVSIKRRDECVFRIGERFDAIISANLKKKSPQLKRKRQSLITKKQDFQWSKVRITSQDDESFLVQYEGANYSVRYDQIDVFVNQRGINGEPNMAWDVFRILLSKGEVESGHRRGTGKVRQQIAKVRKALREELFQTPADPIQDNTKRTGHYRPKFLIGSTALTVQLSHKLQESREDIDEIQEEFNRLSNHER